MSLGPGSAEALSLPQSPAQLALLADLFFATFLLFAKLPHSGAWSQPIPKTELVLKER